MEESPHPGQKRTSWSLWKSFLVRVGAMGASVDMGVRLQDVQDPLEDLVTGERLALHLGQGLDVLEVAGAQQQRELAEVHLGEEDALEARQHLAQVRREGVEIAQVGAAHPQPLPPR